MPLRYRETQGPETRVAREFRLTGARHRARPEEARRARPRDGGGGQKPGRRGARPGLTPLDPRRRPVDRAGGAGCGPRRRLWTARLLARRAGADRGGAPGVFRVGRQVATTASYQASVEGLVAAGYDAAEARRLITRSVTIAREVRDELSERRPGLLVAASVGPYGAFLADGPEYTGRYGVSPRGCATSTGRGWNCWPRRAGPAGRRDDSRRGQGRGPGRAARRGRPARLVQLLGARDPPTPANCWSAAYGVWQAAARSSRPGSTAPTRPTCSAR